LHESMTKKKLHGRRSSLTGSVSRASNWKSSGLRLRNPAHYIRYGSTVKRESASDVLLAFH